jgi:hypothetical protein
MTHSVEQFVVTKATPGDADGVVALLSNKGTSRYWKGREQWSRFYQEYPEGNPVSLIVRDEARIVGHYGLFPVRIGAWPALLGMHAFVSEEYRGLTVISMLMQETDRYAKEIGAACICGFANSQFSLIKKTFFNWKIPFWLGFTSPIQHSDLSADNASFYFAYSEQWYAWRFGTQRNTYFSRYEAADGSVKKQLLKMLPGSVLPSDEALAGCEGWTTRSNFYSKPTGIASQPFSLKLYDRSLLRAGIYDPASWFIEMGDSDTFQYREWPHQLV